MSAAPDIEQLRLLPDEEIIEVLTTRREDQWLERKSVRTTARQLGDALVGFANAEGGVDEVAVIEIESSERVHTNVRGETYLRIGDENRRLGVVEAQELRFDKGESTFDGTAATSSSLSDLDPERVDRYLRRIRATSREAALGARGLVVERRRVTRPTVAGLLTFAPTPQSEFPEAFV